MFQWDDAEGSETDRGIHDPNTPFLFVISQGLFRCSPGEDSMSAPERGRKIVRQKEEERNKLCVCDIDLCQEDFVNTLRNFRRFCTPSFQSPLSV